MMPVIVERARSVAEDVIRPASAIWDREGRWPEEAVRALQGCGLAGATVPRDQGGLAVGLTGLLAICETLGEADASVGLCFGMHCVATMCIAARATPSQADQYLRPIAEGKHWTTLALSEPSTGSHFYYPETEMVQRGERYVLTGNKCFVTNGGRADSYVVSTVAGGDAPIGHFSMVIVGSRALDGAWGAPWDGWGMRANASRAVTLDRVEVPATDLLGEEGDQIWYVFHVVAPAFLVAMAGTYLGVAKRALGETRAHLKERRHGHTGRHLAAVDVLQHRLGSVWGRYQSARALCRWAAEQADRGAEDAVAALCAAKAHVGDAAVATVNECMTLVGGKGYAGGSVLPRLLRDVRAVHVMSPTTDLLHTWTGRALLGLPLLGE